MERVVVSSKEIDNIIAAKQYEESMENVKEGMPSDYILVGPDSPFEQYVKRKTEEYNKRMETFEEEMAERIARNHLKDENGEVDEEDLRDLISKPSSNMKAEFIEDDLF